LFTPDLPSGKGEIVQARVATLVGVEPIGWLSRRPPDLVEAQPRLDRTDNTARQPVLQIKVWSGTPSKRSAQIWAPVALSISWPVMRTRLLAHAVFEHVTP